MKVQNDSWESSSPFSCLTVSRQGGEPCTLKYIKDFTQCVRKTQLNINELEQAVRFYK